MPPLRQASPLGAKILPFVSARLRRFPTPRPSQSRSSIPTRSFADVPGDAAASKLLHAQDGTCAAPRSLHARRARAMPFVRERSTTGGRRAGLAVLRASEGRTTGVSGERTSRGPTPGARSPAIMMTGGRTGQSRGLSVKSAPSFHLPSLTSLFKTPSGRRQS